jgi:hypothetical protein
MMGVTIDRNTATAITILRRLIALSSLLPLNCTACASA